MGIDRNPHDSCCVDWTFPITMKRFYGSLLYVIALNFWFALWVLTGDRFWWMALLNRVVPYLFLPAVLLAGVAMIRREKVALASLLIPLLIFVYLYGAYFLPQRANPTPHANLTVMTYNILYSNQDYDGIAKVIRENHPDLVALQEVQPDTMKALQLRLQDLYPYTKLGTANPYGTTAVLSRYEFVDLYILDLKADRPAVVVKVKVAGEEVVFAASHLLAFNLQWYPWYEIPSAVVQLTHDQNRQAEILVETLGKKGNNIILGCDCNSKETSSSYRILNRTLTNAAHQVSWDISGQNEPNRRHDRDLQHIDYIFYKGDRLLPLSVSKVQDSGGSDHLPLLVTFSLTE